MSLCLPLRQLITRSARAISRHPPPQLHARRFHRTPPRMVEGHQCHRVAHTHRKLLLNHRFKATSPNQRFQEGAAAVDGKPLTRIECHGKNLFYFWGDPADPVVVHIHFGMSGAFKTAALPGPEPTQTTRLQLVNEELGIIGLLSAMTVQYGDLAFYQSKVAKLGADPLREDADPEEVWSRVSASKKPIGLLLMDQSVIAGVGNIYRAEILFKAGVHPEQPGLSVGRSAFDSIWRHSVLLLQRGFQSGSILTVDPQEAKVLGKPWTRRYIYNHKSCGRCGSAIRSWDMAGRTAYACETCQPLALGAGEQLAAGRAKALGAAKQAKVFVSHCAPDDPAEAGATPTKLTVAQLKARLGELGQPTSGRKAELEARLEAALAAGAAGAAPGAPVAAAGAAAAAAAEAAAAAAALPTPSPAARKPARRPAAPAAAPAAPAEGGGEAESPASSHHGWVSPELYSWEEWPAAPEGTPAAAAAAAGAGAAGAGAEVSSAVSQRESEDAGDAEGAAGAAQALPTPGTAVVGRMATAEEAAAEKATAGEGRNVEHVALHTDAATNRMTDKLTKMAAAGGQQRARRGRQAQQAQPQAKRARRAADHSITGEEGSGH